MPVANGEFTVSLTPADDSADAGVRLGRMTLTKSFSGDLTGTGAGQMLTAMTPVAGSAMYVAAERFVGTVHGREGSFAMVHRGHMRAGQQDLVIVIVPDSGTGALVGIEGNFHIRIADGKHYYTLDYTLPDA